MLVVRVIAVACFLLESCFWIHSVPNFLQSASKKMEKEPNQSRYISAERFAAQAPPLPPRPRRRYCSSSACAVRALVDRTRKSSLQKKKTSAPIDTADSRQNINSSSSNSSNSNSSSSSSSSSSSISAHLMYIFLFLLLLSGLGISYFFQGWHCLGVVRISVIKSLHIIVAGHLFLGRIGITNKSRPCSNFGFRSAGQCQCYRGKTGTDCRTDPNPALQDGTPFWITHNFNQRTLQGQECA